MSSRTAALLRIYNRLLQVLAVCFYIEPFLFRLSPSTARIIAILKPAIDCLEIINLLFSVDIDNYFHL
jgi:hypothetical protein